MPIVIEHLQIPFTSCMMCKVSKFVVCQKPKTAEKKFFCRQTKKVHRSNVFFWQNFRNSLLPKICFQWFSARTRIPKTGKPSIQNKTESFVWILFFIFAAYEQKRNKKVFEKSVLKYRLKIGGAWNDESVLQSVGLNLNWPRGQPPIAIAFVFCSVIVRLCFAVQ